jgi:hypothetical protein
MLLTTHCKIDYSAQKWHFKKLKINMLVLNLKYFLADKTATMYFFWLVLAGTFEL